MLKKHLLLSLLILFTVNLYCPSSHHGGSSNVVQPPAPVVQPQQTNYTVITAAWGGMDGRTVMVNGAALQYNGMTIRGDGSVVELSVITSNGKSNILAISGNPIIVNNQIYQVSQWPAPQVESPVNYSGMNAQKFAAQPIPSTSVNLNLWIDKAISLLNPKKQSFEISMLQTYKIQLQMGTITPDALKVQLEPIRKSIESGSMYTLSTDKASAQLSSFFDKYLPILVASGTISKDDEKKLKKEEKAMNENPTKDSVKAFMNSLQEVYAKSVKGPSALGTLFKVTKGDSVNTDDINALVSSMKPGIFMFSSLEPNQIEILAGNPKNVVLFEGISSNPKISPRTRDIIELFKRIDQGLIENNPNLYIFVVDCYSKKDQEKLSKYLPQGLKPSDWYPSYAQLIKIDNKFILVGVLGTAQTSKDDLYDIASSYGSSSIYPSTTSTKETSVIKGRLAKLPGGIKV